MHRLWNHGPRLVTVTLSKGRKLTLTPQMNLISDEDWKEIDEARKGTATRKKNAALAALFDSTQNKLPAGLKGTQDGHLEDKGEVPGEVPSKAKDPKAGGASTKGDEVDKSLGELNAKDAIEMVDGTLGVEQLRAWKRGEEAGEKRKTVLEAIDAQLARIFKKDDAGEAAKVTASAPKQ